jgi:folate-binding protein YgfZ
MNTEWHDFLTHSAAGAALPSEGPAFCGLTSHGLLKVSGDDAATFLQGQTTCDVHALRPGRTGVGAICTAKGRVVANFRLLRSEQGFHLLLAADLAGPIRERLQMYVLRSKVVLEDLTPTWGMLGILNKGGELTPADAGIPLAPGPGEWLETPDTLLALTLDDGSERLLIAAPTATARWLWAKLQESLPVVSSEAWWLKDIEAGYPEIVAATSEQFLPQMLNLDILGGIGFKKGCYTGQEIVTRTHYLGQVKRRMFRLRCAGMAEDIGAGAAVYDLSEGEPKLVGQVVMAARESAASRQLLAVLSLEYADRNGLRIVKPDGPAAEFLPLPYSLDFSSV